jgi:hypothetical protein
MRKAILFTFVISLLMAVSCGGNNGGGSGGGGSQIQPTYTGAMKCSQQVTSPKGVIICSGGSIGADVPGIADQQLGDLFRIAGDGQTTASGTNNYHPCPDGSYDGSGTCFSTYATYHIWLIPRSPQCENPGFTELVTSAAWPDGYDNDPNGWDKDPTPGRTILCVAGMMEAGGGKMQGLAVPGMGVVDAIDTMPIVRYEGEHNLLAQVDQVRYAATQYHFGTNGGHPILGDGPPAMAKAARRFQLEKPPIEAKDKNGNSLWVVK